jgi:hypothetical protein
LRELLVILQQRGSFQEYIRRGEEIEERDRGDRMVNRPW